MLKISNYYKRTPRSWKMVGDICLFIAPLFSGAVMAAPFMEPTKSWILFGINIILITGKIITKFIGNEPIEPIDNSIE
jgi:hypothetical protein